MTKEQYNSYVMQGFREELEKNAVWGKAIISGVKSIGKGMIRGGAAAGRGISRLRKAVPKLTSKSRAFASREARRLKASKLRSIAAGKKKASTVQEAVAANRMRRLKRGVKTTPFPKEGTKAFRRGKAPVRRQTRVSQLTGGGVDKKIKPSLKSKAAPSPTPVQAPITPKPKVDTEKIKKIGFGSKEWHVPAAAAAGGYALGRL